MMRGVSGRCAWGIKNDPPVYELDGGALEAIANGADDRLWVVFFYSDRSKRDRDAKASVLRPRSNLEKSTGRPSPWSAQRARLARARAPARPRRRLRQWPEAGLRLPSIRQVAQRRHEPAPGPRKRPSTAGPRGSPWGLPDTELTTRLGPNGGHNDACNKRGIKLAPRCPSMVPLRVELNTARISQPLLLHLELVEVRAVDELLLLLRLLRARRGLARFRRYRFPLVGHDLPAVGVGAGLALRLPRLRFRVGPGLQGQQRLLRLRGELGGPGSARRGRRALAQGRAASASDAPGMTSTIRRFFAFFVCFCFLGPWPSLAAAGGRRLLRKLRLLCVDAAGCLGSSVMLSAL